MKLEPRIKLLGNQEIGKTFIGEAQRQLSALHNNMSFQKLKQGTLRKEFDPGIFVNVTSCYDRDFIIIYVPEWVKKLEKKPVSKEATVLIVRMKGGTKYHYTLEFPETYGEEATITQVDDLNAVNSTLKNTNLEKGLVDIEEDAGITPPSCCVCVYIAKDSTYYFMLGAPWYDTAFRTNTYPDLLIWATQQNAITLYPEPSIFDSWYSFFTIGAALTFGQEQDVGLALSIMGNIQLDSNYITIARQSDDIYYSTEKCGWTGSDVCYEYHNPTYEKYSYDGTVIYDVDITTNLRSYYGATFPFIDATPAEEASDPRICGWSYTPVSMFVDSSGGYLYVKKHYVEKTYARALYEYCHKFEIDNDGSLTYLSSADETPTPDGKVWLNDTGTKKAYWSDDVYYDLTWTYTYVADVAAPATEPDLYTLNHDITFYFYDITINLSATAYVHKVWHYWSDSDYHTYPCTISPLAWHRYSSKTYLVYNENYIESPTDTTYGTQDIAGDAGDVRFYVSTYTTTSRNYLKIPNFAAIELTDEDGNEVKCEYTHKVYNTRGYWTKDVEYSGKEIKDVSLCINDNKLLVTYVIETISKDFEPLTVHTVSNFEINISSVDTSWAWGDHIFAFYDLATGELICKNTIASVPSGTGADYMLTAGFFTGKGKSESIEDGIHSSI